MDQWTSKLKKLLHLEKQPQPNHQQNLANTVTQTNTETQKVQVQQLYNFLQQKVNKDPKKIIDQMDQSDHSSDEDSLGYTENDWDQQTINFELQDRMLDCLQDQKHANQYRESLAQSSLMRKRNEQRFSKPDRPPSPKQNEFNQNQLDFQKIIQQHNPNPQTLTQSHPAKSSNEDEKKSIKPQRRNRFSKYKKQSQNKQTEQKSFFPHFTPEQQQKLDKIFKKKVQQFQAQGNQTCDDYIARVFNLRTYEQQNFDKRRNEKQNDQKETKQVLIQDGEVKKCEQMKKKLSIPSQGSFEVVEEIRHLNLSEINKKESGKSSSSTEMKKNENSLYRSENVSNQIKSIKDELKSKEQTGSIQLVNANLNQQNKDELKNQTNQKKQNTLQPLILINNQQTLPQNQTKQINFPQNNPLSFQQLNQSIPQQNNQIYIRPYYQKKLPIIYSPIKKTQQVIESPFKKNNPQLSKPQSFGVIKIKQSPEPIKFSIAKSPQAKIQFNYVNQQQKTNIKFGYPQDQPQKQNYVAKVIFNNQPKFQRQNEKKSSRVTRLQAQPQERIPIFLQRLRRLISTYPNFYLYNVDLQKIRNDLKIILNSMRSAISVIQLLFKKMKIQRNRLQEPFIKINRCKNLSKIQSLELEKLNCQIWDFFMNSGWEDYKIEEIQFIKPKQKFKRRTLNSLKVEEALQMYNQFISIYLSQAILITNTPDEIKRYIRIRQKISDIVQYLRMISQDLYSYWLVDCHYPHIYNEFLEFLKQDNQKGSINGQSDQIYAKLIEAQQYNDPLSTSIIGMKIIEKVQQFNNSS